MPNRTIRLAYADDHVAVRAGISALIEMGGMCTVIIQAANGQELLDALGATPVPPDLCLLDVFMPVMDGLQTLLAIRSRWSELPVIMLTGHNTEYYLIRSIAAGAAGYLPKNSSPKELEAAIVAVHTTGVYAGTDSEAAEVFRAIRQGRLQPPRFTENEATFLKLCCTDLSYVQIAERMGVSPRSVDWYRDALFKKLAVASRSGLVMYAVQTGLVPLNEKSVRA